MHDAVAKEIAELHQFFQDYFRGVIDPVAISRFVDAMGDGFTIINSAGHIADRTTIINVIRNAHNQRHNIKIWTENHQIRQIKEGLIVATYEEWQTTDETTQRQATVVFQQDEAAPNGLLWLHVHESGLRVVNA